MENKKKKSIMIYDKEWTERTPIKSEPEFNNKIIDDYENDYILDIDFVYAQLRNYFKKCHKKYLNHIKCQ